MVDHIVSHLRLTYPILSDHIVLKAESVNITAQPIHQFSQVPTPPQTKIRTTLAHGGHSVATLGVTDLLASCRVCRLLELSSLRCRLGNRPVRAGHMRDRCFVYRSCMRSATTRVRLRFGATFQSSVVKSHPQSNDGCVCIVSGYFISHFLAFCPGYRCLIFIFSFPHLGAGKQARSHNSV